MVLQLVAACEGEDPDAFLPPTAQEVVEAAVQNLPPSMLCSLANYTNGVKLVDVCDNCTSQMGSDASVDEVSPQVL